MRSRAVAFALLAGALFGSTRAAADDVASAAPKAPPTVEASPPSSVPAAALSNSAVREGAEQPKVEASTGAPSSNTESSMGVAALARDDAAVRKDDDASFEVPRLRAGKVVVTPVLDVLTQYVVSVRAQDGSNHEWYHEFELPRALLGAAATYENARVGLVAETVRSTSGGSLIGVAGESIVLRVRAAYLGYELFERLSVKAGVVPTLLIPELERSWGLRVLAPTALERTGAWSPADLGATARVLLPRGFGSVSVGVYNGEGYTGRELNRGKSLEAVAVLHPGALGPGWAKPLAVFGSYVAGSTGTGRARADRVSGGLAYATRAIGVGALVTYGLGFEDEGGRRFLLVDGFARAQPWRGLLVGGQAIHFRRDLSVTADHFSVLTGAVGYRLVEPLEALLAVDRQLAGSAAAPTLPSLDAWRIRAVARFHLE